MSRLLAEALRRLTIFLCAPVPRWIGSEPTTRQRVYFANHTSHADFAVIWASLPPEVRARTRPVANGTYWSRTPLARYVAARVFRSILVEHASARGGATAEQVAASAAATVDRIAFDMGDDTSVIIFPEGHRSRDGTMAPFKSGLYHLCRAKPGLELIPVYLENLDRMLPKGELIPIPLLASVTFGPPMRLGEGEGKEEFLARARAAVEGLRTP